jgi:hypothetical protein
MPQQPKNTYASAVPGLNTTLNMPLSLRVESPTVDNSSCNMDSPVGGPGKGTSVASINH